jgi:hypothetical protein
MTTLRERALAAFQAEQQAVRDAWLAEIDRRKLRMAHDMQRLLETKLGLICIPEISYELTEQGKQYPAIAARATVEDVVFVLTYEVGCYANLLRVERRCEECGYSQLSSEVNDLVELGAALAVGVQPHQREGSTDPFNLCPERDPQQVTRPSSAHPSDEDLDRYDPFE